MTSSVTGMVAALERRAEDQRQALIARLDQAQRSGRTEMTLGELQAERDVHALAARIHELRDEELRAGDVSDLSRRITEPNRNSMSSHAKDANLVYRAADRRTSYIRDMMRASIPGYDDDYSSQRRLAAHAEQVRNHPAYTEYRDLSRVDGQGGYAVPPAWLMDQYVELARPGRPFANLCQIQPLPGGTDSINIPKILSGTAVGIQTADNTTVVDVDLTDTFINAPVRTIAGQQGVALQLLDQSPLAFDDVIFRDLVAAFATDTDKQVMSGTGTNGQVLGVDFTPGTSTIAMSTNDIQGFYNAIANAIQTIHTTRFMPPEVVVMHPVRWAWCLSLLDTTDRPLFLPTASNPMNAVGIQDGVHSQGVVGQVAGLPIVVDPSVTTTAGSGSGGGNQDVVYVLRASDLLLWETGPRMRVLAETKAQNLTVLCQVYGYLAFSAARQPSSVVTITGLPHPTF